METLNNDHLIRHYVLAIIANQIVNKSIATYSYLHAIGARVITHPTIGNSSHPVLFVMVVTNYYY